MTPEEIAAIIEDHKYPTLHAGDTGIHVITLQIWLQMLGFYQGPITGLLDAATAQAVDAFRAQQRAAGIALKAPTSAVLERDTWQAMDNILQQRLPPDPATLEHLPFPRRSSHDSEAKYYKSLYEGLRAFGFPVKPAQEPIRLPVVINENGVGILHGVPPGSYTLELGSAGSPGRGSAEIHLEDADGTPLSGQIRLVRAGGDQPATVTAGHTLVNGLEPGDYQVVIERVDDVNQIIDNTGSVEVHLVDESNRPAAGTAFLVGETGDLASLQRAVRLYQALSRNVTRGLEPGDKSRLGMNLLSADFAETAHSHHQLVWDNFEQTWGRFYGAPWMGVIFHPLDREEAWREEELNWGERETIAMLYEWGNAYLQSAQDRADLEERLRRPVAIRYIARPLGGNMNGLADFSQIGTDASLHLPRTQPMFVSGFATGQTYGGVDYDSPDYSSPHLEIQLSAFASLYTISMALCPDVSLVHKLPSSFAEIVIADLNPISRSINAKGKKRKPRVLSPREQRELSSSVDLQKGIKIPDPELANNLTRELILRYVPNSGAVARKWIDENISNNQEKMVAELLLRGLINHYGKSGSHGYPHGKYDLDEQYELYSRGLTITGEIHQPFLPTNRFLSNSKNYNYSGKDKKGNPVTKTATIFYTTIRIISGDIKPDTNQASGISPKMIQQPHYEGNDNVSKVDLAAGYNDKLVWFGPAFPFKVLSVEIFTDKLEEKDHRLNAFNELRIHGSKIVIKILSDTRHPEDQIPNLSLVHFTAIHRDIYEQGILPPEQPRRPFNPGTFLGMTKRLTGWSTGLHLHLHIEPVGRKTYTRKDIYKLWTGHDADLNPK